MSMSRLAELPGEIILKCFSFAAASSHRTAQSLSLVSSWVKRSTAPYLYATVILSSFHQVAVFLHLLRLRPGIKGYNAKIHLSVNPGSYVRNICITHFAPRAWRTYSGEEVDPYAAIFEACKKVERAALLSTFLHSSLVPHYAVQKLKSRELVVMGPTFPSDWEKHAEALAPSAHEGEDSGADLRNGVVVGNTQGQSDSTSGPSILRHVSHLRLMKPLSSPHYSGKHLARLPQLTHLSLTIYEQIYSPTLFGELQPILALPRIQAIVLCIDFNRWLDKTRKIEEWAKLAQNRDERLFVVQQNSMHHKDEVASWVETVEGGEDIWARAQRERDERKRLPIDT